MLNKGLDELLAETGQAVAVLAGEAEVFTLWGQLFAIHRQEIEVRGKSTQKVQDVVTTVIPDDTFALHRRTQFHRLVLLIQYIVFLHLKFTPKLIDSL